MANLAADLRRIAHRIETDEDFAMRVGENPRGALEAEGLPDGLIGQVLAEALSGTAGAEVVGFAMPTDDVALAVDRVARAARAVADG